MSNKGKKRVVNDQEMPSCSYHYKPPCDEGKRVIRKQMVGESGQFHTKAIKLDPTEKDDDGIDTYMDASDIITPDASLEGKEIWIYMDISEPLTTLRTLLEEELERNLADYTFSLQNAQRLDENKNLVDQCVQGEGLVQINCELQGSVRYGKLINITDILKPDEESMEILRKMGISEFMDSEEREEPDVPDPDPVIEGTAIMIHMDIREPLTTLRSLLEEKLEQNLQEFKFCLQESQKLDENKNLVDQCVKGEGLVQINCELQVSSRYGKIINITDVLKPAEEYIEILSNADDDDECSTKDQKVRWIVDPSFKKDQMKLGIPEDPRKWTVQHVRHWLMWAVRQFGLSGIKLSDWAITGLELSKMSQEGFNSRVPADCNSSFWTHFKLLQRCKVVAVIKADSTYVPDEDTEEPDADDVDEAIGVLEASSEASQSAEIWGESSTKQEDAEKAQVSRVIKSTPAVNYDDTEFAAVSSSPFTSTTSVGPVQLWVFLLDLLTDWRHRKAIQWVGDGSTGEFVMVNPELVAYLWGLRKQKPNMNYEKLSRALRYYYDGQMISKVPRRKFVYKFDCDLKMIIGFSSAELQAEVIGAEKKFKKQEKKMQKSQAMSGPVFVNDVETLLQ